MPTVEQMYVLNRHRSTRGIWRAWCIAAPLTLGILCVSTTAFAAPGQPDPEATAIQTVIQQANQEQSQALTSGDPSVMIYTATAAYYAQLVQTNQEPVGAGATHIELTQLTWTGRAVGSIVASHAAADVPHA